MTANQQLRNAYAEWRRLAEQEGEAIRQSNWPAVEICQTSLHDLQPQIIRWTQQAREEWMRQGSDIALEEDSLRAVIGELIDIERRNSATLNDVRQAAHAEARQLEQTGQTLRQVQRSYAPQPSSAWTSFS
jgi:hypothetical protein